MTFIEKRKAKGREILLEIGRESEAEDDRAVKHLLNVKWSLTNRLYGLDTSKGEHPKGSAAALEDALRVVEDEITNARKV